jgi:predicted DsbA family dithiol-disulfide isomerase
MHVEIWSDIACPWCYVGKRRFETALALFAHRETVTVSWRSFELDPQAPAQYDMTQPELLARKYGKSLPEAHAMNAQMTAAAAAEGLSFRLSEMKVGNTFDAHRLLHLAGTHGKRDVLGERLFAAYLGEGAALSDPGTLVALAAEAGLDGDAVRTMLRGDAYANEVRREEAEARELGVTGVPFFVIDRRYGVSGAQSPEVLQEVLQRAWDERAPTVAALDDHTGAAACTDDGCAV